MAYNNHLSKEERERLKNIGRSISMLTENDEIAHHDTIACLQIFRSQLKLLVEQHQEKTVKNNTNLTP